MRQRNRGHQQLRVQKRQGEQGGHHVSFTNWTCNEPAGCDWFGVFVSVQPLIDCAVCYKTYDGVVEASPKPYVHCIHRPALTEVSALGLTFTRCSHIQTSSYRMTLGLWLTKACVCCLLFVGCQVMKTARINHCNEMGYSSGSPTLLASVGA